jgi:tRNA 2-thiouridine synthesizing protein A
MTMSGVEVVTHTSEADSLRHDQALAADKTLDLRGVACPLPPLKTVRALGKMRPGEILEVLGTSPIGNHSAPFWARVLGNQLLRVVPDDGFKRFFYRKR